MSLFLDSEPEISTLCSTYINKTFQFQCYLYWKFVNIPFIAWFIELAHI